MSPLQQSSCIGNFPLSQFNPGILPSIAAQFEIVELELCNILSTPNQVVTRAYFPLSWICSVIAPIAHVTTVSTAPARRRRLMACGALSQASPAGLPCDGLRLRCCERLPAAILIRSLSSPSATALKIGLMMLGKSSNLLISAAEQPF